MVNAVPWATYTADNPSNYAQGIYGGLTVVFIPQLGFQSIIINLNITDLLTL